MTEVPTTDWRAGFDPNLALDSAPRIGGRGALRWRRLPGVVSHTFTHFPLELTVYVAGAPQAAAAPEGTRFMPAADIATAAFPTVMRKVLAHAGAA
jgi:A/G-specific adenine glycosylase